WCCTACPPTGARRSRAPSLRTTPTRSSPWLKTASTSRRPSWPSCWPASDPLRIKKQENPLWQLTPGRVFAIIIKLQNKISGGVLKWSKRRDSKSVRIFGSQISKGQGVKPLFEGGCVPGKRTSSLHIFSKVFQRFTISYLEQYSSGRRGVTRNLVEP